MPRPPQVALHVVVLLVIGAVVRVLYQGQIAADPLSSQLILDAAFYDAWGRRIADGELIGGGVFQSNPLYPYALGAVYAVTDGSVAAVRALQHAATLLACAALARVAWLRLGRSAAVWTLGLGVLYGPLILFGGEILGESLVVALLAVSLWLAFEAPGFVGRSRLAASLGSGVALGLACLGRPNLLPLAPLLALFLATDRPTGPRAGLHRGAAAALGLALAIAPATIHNIVVGGEAVLVRAHGGVNLWIGNHPDGTGWFSVPPESGLTRDLDGLLAAARTVAEERAGHGLSAREVSSWWVQRAVEDIRARPGDWLALVGRKSLYVLNAYEKPLIASLDRGREVSWALRLCTVGYGLVLPLAVLGLGFGWVRRREHWLLLATAGVALGTVVVFFVSMRFRLPALAGLLPFAGAGAAGIVERVRSTPPRSWGPWVVPLLLSLAIVHIPVPGQQARDRAHTQHLLGNLAGEREEWEVAVGHQLAAIDLQPDDAGYWNNLGLAWGGLGRDLEEVAALRRAVELAPTLVAARFNLGVALASLGRPEEAVEHLEVAAELLPDEPLVRAELEAARAAAREASGEGDAGSGRGDAPSSE